jgi:hypothetical protein
VTSWCGSKTRSMLFRCKFADYQVYVLHVVAYSVLSTHCCIHFMKECLYCNLLLGLDGSELESSLQSLNNIPI